MIATVTGVLADREGETVVVQTDGGVGYAVTVPLGVFERLPPRGARVSLHTELVVREDGWALFGFDRAADRVIFQRLLGASGFGPKLALAVLSALGPDRTVRSIRERDIAALSTVTGIGRKKAERLVLELRDRFDDVAVAPAERPASGSDQAVRALVALGYSPAAAEEAVRGALANGANGDTAVVVRQALAGLAGSKT
jgi:Holliday junction DNA helicase RuvA